MDVSRYSYCPKNSKLRHYPFLRILFLFLALYQVACGPGAQVLEQQRRQIQANQQLIAENRRLLQAEKDRVV